MIKSRQVIVLLVLAVATGCSQKAPKIQLDRTVYDFGTTYDVDTVSGKFIVQNVGGATLELPKLGTSCGCATAGLKQDRLRPGEKGELVFSIDLTNKRGPIEEHITVQSNDPQSPQTQLTIKAIARHIVEASPPIAWFGNLPAHMATHSSVTIRRTDGKKLVIKNVETSSAMLSIKVVSEEKGQAHRAMMFIEPDTNGKPGRFQEQVRVYTDDSPSRPVCVIPVLGRIVGGFMMNPELLSWVITDPTEELKTRSETFITRHIHVHSMQGERPLELRNLGSNLAQLQVELSTLEAGKEYDLVAKLIKIPRETAKGTISFETNLPSEPKVEVPVTIHVLKP